LEEAVGPGFEVWPDCWDAVEVFRAMDTQWRHAGMAGVYIGLEYAALPVVMQLKRIPKKKWPEVFEDLRALETAALEFLNKKK
jgi:hypothetical protein